MRYKICVISSLFYPYTKGGAEKVAELVAQGLQEEGHKVFVVSICPWRGLFSFLPKTSTPSNSPYSDASVGTGGERTPSSAQGGSASGGNSPYSDASVGTGGEIISAHSPCFRNAEIGGDGGGVKIYRFCPLNIFSFISIDKYPLIFRLIWRIFDIFNLHSALVLWYILRKEQPDCVWTHNLTGFGLFTPLLLKILKIPHIHTLHDVSLIEPSGIIIKGKERGGFLTRLIFGSITRRLFGSPTLIVSPSEWLLDFYLGHGFFKGSKILVKQNPISFPVIPRPDIYRGEESIRIDSLVKPGNDNEVKPGNDNEKRTNILYIGQLEKHKGILFLISALNELAAKYDFKLLVVGTGKLINHLKKLDKKWLVLCGKLDQEDLTKIWKETNITLVPSLTYENSPAVIYESFANGIPVIASRIGGIPELVENGKNGFLFEAGDAEGLRKKLIEIFENPAIIQNLSQGALTFKVKLPRVYVGEILNNVEVNRLC